MNKKMVGWNALVAVVFVLLLIAHIFILDHALEWTRHFEGYWPAMDTYVLKSLLAFTTGYVLFAALFSLLKAKIEIAGLRRWNLLRIVMLLVTVFFVVSMLITVAVVSGLGSFLSHGLMMFFVGVAQAEWLWLALGVYWFLSLNALRVAELPPLDDDDFDDDDFDEE